MNLISFAREMRRRGWSYQRREKGLAYFGTRFPNGKGRTIAIDLTSASYLRISPGNYADYLTREAALAVGHDMRAGAA